MSLFYGYKHIYVSFQPQAIRTRYEPLSSLILFVLTLCSLDVYGENARKIVPINSPVFGRVFAACIGAMMVGSIITTVEEGDHVKRGQEFGYFAFGMSFISS